MNPHSLLMASQLGIDRPSGFQVDIDFLCVFPVSRPLFYQKNSTHKSSLDSSFNIRLDFQGWWNLQGLPRFVPYHPFFFLRLLHPKKPDGFQKNLGIFSLSSLDLLGPGAKRKTSKSHFPSPKIGSLWVFPKIGIPQKWMVHNGKSHQNGWFGHTHVFLPPRNRVPPIPLPVVWPAFTPSKNSGLSAGTAPWAAKQSQSAC